MVSEGIRNFSFSFLSSKSEKSCESRSSVKDGFENTFDNVRSGQSFTKTYNIGTEKNGKSEKSEKTYGANKKAAEDSCDAEDRIKKGFAAKNRVQGKKVKDLENVSDGESKEDILESVYQFIIVQVREQVCDKLNVTQEQLDVILDDLNLKETDLLNASGISAVVMKEFGIDNPIDAIMNTDFTNTIKELVNFVETEINKNISDDIDVEKIIENHNKILETAVGDQNADVGNKHQNSVYDQGLNKKENIEKIAEPDEKVINFKDSEKVLNDSNGNSNSQTSGQKKGTLSDSQNLSENINNTLSQNNNFVDKLTQTISETVGETDADQILRQVIEEITVKTKQDTTSIEMQLYPEHLGKVYIQVASKDGVLTASITAESEAAKKAMESQLTILKDNFNNQGLKVENVEVTIASHSFEQNSGQNGENQQNYDQKRKKVSGIFFRNVENEEENQEKVMEVMGNTVSYLA